MTASIFNFNIKKKEELNNIINSSEQSNSPGEMTNEEFEKMRSLIYNLSGIYFTDTKKYLLESRINKRIASNNKKSYSDYIHFLQTSQGRKELDALFEAITINETFFFRVPQQFDALETVILPELIQKKVSSGNSTIRIWSAACSTGEEAYTIAIIIQEKLKPLYPNVNFQILGTDINVSVLETANQAVYKDYAVRNIPEHFLNKYFIKDNNHFALKDEIKKMVKFSYMNLYDTAAMRAVPSCDVIFCSNVLIYFDMPSKQKVVSDLYYNLIKGGYLLVGYSESLYGVSKAFRLVHLPKAMAYQKD